MYQSRCAKYGIPTFSTTRLALKVLVSQRSNTLNTQAIDTLEDYTFENVYAMDEFSEDVQTISVSITECTNIVT